MFYTLDDLELAKRHVVEADARILRQQALIERLADRGSPTQLARDLLQNLEDTVAQMRIHRDAIEVDVQRREAR